MEKNERFNSIVKQLESVKSFASLFEAKNQYQGALQVKSSSYGQLAALFAIEEEQAEKLVEEVSALGVDAVKEMPTDEKKQLLSKYVGEAFFEEMDEEFINTTTNTVIELKGMMDELDESIAECEAEIAKVEENIKETTQQYGDIYNLLKTNLEEVLQEKHSEAVYDAARQQLNAMENSLTLEPVIELYKNIGVNNTKKEYKDRIRREATIKKFVAVMKKLNIKASLASFINKGVDEFINEENRCDKDLLLYAIMKYEAGKSFTSKKFLDGMFMVQLTINFYQLFTGVMDPKNKERFIESLNELSAMFK